MLSSGLNDGSVVIWDALEVNARKRGRILEPTHSYPLWSLSFSPDGRFLATASKNEIIIWLAEVRNLGINELVFGVCSQQHWLGFFVDISK